MIREIKEKDLSSVKSLLIELNNNNGEYNDEKLKASINKIYELDHMKILGFEKENTILGMCTIARIEGISYGGRPFAVIENVVVTKRERSQGIGKNIILKAVEVAEKWNCYKVIIETGSKQEWKLDFYENCGFRRGEKTAFLKKLK